MRPKFHRLALKVVLIYGATSAGWILFSDKLADIISSGEGRTIISIVKGWAFVLVTALLLYGMLRRIFVRLEHEELIRQQAEAARRSSEQSYREIFNATNEAICLHDATSGNIVDVNAALLRLYGYDSKAEALALHMENFRNNVPPYTLADARNKIQQAMQTGPQVFEWLARKKNGETFWVEVSLRGSEIGGQGRILAVIREITERKRTETALRESEQKFSKVFHASPVAMSLTTRQDGRYLDVNDEFLRTIERPRDEVIGRTSLELDLWPVPAQRAAILSNLQRHGSIRNLELDFKAKSGRIIHVLWSLEEISINGEHCLLGSALDITLRQRAEQALRESEESLRRLGDNLPNGYVYQSVHQADGRSRFRYLSAGAERIHGIAIAEILQDSAVLYHQVLPEDLAKLAAAERRAQLDLSVFSEEVRLCPPNGNVVWLRFNSAPRQLDDGSVIWDGVALNITASKQTEAALEQERNLLRTLIDHIPDMIYVRDLANRFVIANQSAARHLGVNTPAELTGRTEADFYPPETAAELAATDQKVLGGGEVIDQECLQAFPNGERLHVAGTKVPLKNAQGTVTGLVGILRDISERKQAEAQLTGQLEELQRWYRVTLEREDRVQQLKREVNQLLTRLGEPGQYASQACHPSQSVP